VLRPIINFALGIGPSEILKSWPEGARAAPFWLETLVLSDWLADVG
jgi:hypothetical protein